MGLRLSIYNLTSWLSKQKKELIISSLLSQPVSSFEQLVLPLSFLSIFEDKAMKDRLTNRMSPNTVKNGALDNDLRLGL